MTTAELLLPATILLPLGTAAVLLALAHWLPPRVADAAAILCAAAELALCAWLAHVSLSGPVAHWFGGWAPAVSGRPGVVLGIGFLADPASTLVASFAAFVFLATFVFAWGFFDDIHAHFHVLMLLFLGAMVGFCLTHDLFNLFVWFELMSVAAFALTAYPLGGSALDGAFNFTITNAIASFAMLAGTGLLYARTGTLDFGAMAAAVARAGRDPVVTGGFCLLSLALLTKSAILPCHLWLSDAHTVAPSPVSVVFSGIMVSTALFGLDKLVVQVFAHAPDVLLLVRTGFCWAGVATALVAGLMAWGQRHLKRLLAFSTVAHMGIMLAGVATLAPVGQAGLIVYVLGHGLVKGALFMVAGILLALRASVDEIALRGRARRLWPVGVVACAAGLLLGGLPVGLLHEATHLLHEAAHSRALDAALIVSTALTGAAVLRASLRIFFGWTGVPGPEFMAPSERETEVSNRAPWLMLAPCAAMTLLAMLPSRVLDPFVAAAAARLADPASRAVLPVPPAHASAASLATLGLTLALTALALVRSRPTTARGRAAAAVERAPFRLLGDLHSGMVGDYVAWMMVGLAGMAAVLASAG